MSTHNIQFHNKIRKKNPYPVSILYKSIAGRYRPVSYPDGPITARYRFIKNADWVNICFLELLEGFCRD